MPTLPNRCHDTVHRTPEQVREDIVLYFLLQFWMNKFAYLNISRLHRIWGSFLHELEFECCVEVEGFNYDSTIHRFEALDVAIRGLMTVHLVSLDGNGNLNLNFTPQIIAQAKCILAPSVEWEAVESLFPMVLRSYV